MLTLVLLGSVFISAVVPVRYDEDGNDHREGPEQSFVAAVLAAAGPPSACHGVANGDSTHSTMSSCLAATQSAGEKNAKRKVQ